MSIKEAKFTSQNIEFPINIKVGTAIFFKQEFKFNLLNLFEGDNVSVFLETMSLNDEKIIDLMWYYVKDKIEDKEAWIDSLERKDLTEFKDAFWEGVLNFSDLAARPVLQELRRQLPELLKQNVVQNLLGTQNQSQQKLSS